MRLITLGLMLALGLSAAPLAVGATQLPTDTTKTDSTKKVKKPSKLGKIAKGFAEPAATAAAGAGVQSLLGDKTAGGVANALGGVTPCGTGYGVTAGTAIVGAAKGIVKKAVDTTPAPPPCGQAVAIPGMPAGIPGMPAGIPGMPAGIPGMPTAAGAGAAMAGAALGGVLGGAAPGGSPASGMGGMGAMASMTPVGLAVSAAPGAIKGVKGLLGGKPQDKTAMLRELGKGKLEFKHVKFIEGTQEFEPGFEASFVAFAEAIALVEGTYIMHVSAEASRDKGAAPDTALARKRVAKVWALMAANGVSDQKVLAVNELPAPLSAGRKLPKAGDVKIEIIKFEKQP
jgi:hypothetical protein